MMIPKLPSFRFCIYGVLIIVSTAALVLFVSAFSALFSIAVHWAASTTVSSGWMHILQTVAAFILGSHLCRTFAPAAVGSGILRVHNVLVEMHKGDTQNASAVLGVPTMLVKKSVRV